MGLPDALSASSQALFDKKYWAYILCSFYCSGINVTSKRQLTALAYFLKVESDGECFPLLKDDSSRVTAVALVPIFWAISAWVIPAY